MKYKKFTILTRQRRRERGVVLIAVLMFIALIIPVTLLILDSVRIESLLPVNEAYSRTAGDEADKGFNDALAAIMADQDRIAVDVSRDYTDPTQNWMLNLDPDSRSGKHGYDYLAEMWARHPENDTLFLVERSVENIANPENPGAGADPDIHSVPVRWQLMNVPFGIDDFNEYYNDGSSDNPRYLLPFEYVGEDNLSAAEKKAPAYYIDPSELSMLAGQHEGFSPSNFSSDDLTDGAWMLSPADPNFYENLGNLDSIIQFRPRPASYFRNTNGEPFVGIGDAGLPADEGSFSPGFMREDPNLIDRLVYDCAFDYGFGTNQYPMFMPLQQACSNTQWTNHYFGSTGGSGNLAAVFASNNLEYKPAPGSIARYQLGAQEDEAVPGWHEAIVSDESGRFPINGLLNIIYASQNIDYENPDEPWTRRDQYDYDIDADFVNNLNDHPNQGGFLMARDILISLLISDGDMARLADSWDQNLYNIYKEKANWLLRQMLTRRRQLDESSDFNRNGDFSDDESPGEVFRFPELFRNNNSDSLDIAPPDEDLLDGSGRLNDGRDIWDGTWQVYTNPKEIMTDFIGEAVPPAGSRRLSQLDFQTLNQRITVYSFDTEHTADPNHESIPIPPNMNNAFDVRLNIQHMWPQDMTTTPLEDESALWDILTGAGGIGTARAMSIINWREGMVDLNGDGDLNDEYIEQPVSDERYDPDTDSYVDLEDWPVSTITYRERNHPNFQNPQLPDQLIDPDLLNIRSLGDLITIPMSGAEGLIAFSQALNAADTPDLVIKTEAGADPDGIPRSEADRVYPDFSGAGTDIAYDDGTEVYRNNILLNNEQSVQNNRLHPSWGLGDSAIVYYNGDDIHMYDIATSTDTVVLANADLPPDIDAATAAGLDFIGEWNLTDWISDAVFEMGSPDLSPNYAEIAFTQIAATSGGSDFMDPANAYNIALYDMNTGIVDSLTDNQPGTFDYAPDFSPDGQFIVFTRTTYYPFGFGPLPFPITMLMTMDRNGGSLNYLDFPGDPDPGTSGDGLFEIIGFTGTQIQFLMHQPMFANFSPDGQNLVFMDVRVTFTVDINFGPPITITFSSADGANADVLTRDSAEAFQLWSDMRNIGLATARYEIFPDWGTGNIRMTRQNDSQNGLLRGIPISLANASLATTDVTPEDVHFTQTDRQNIAMDIGEASIALRKSIGWGANNQNWLLKDLPAVPEHTVDILEKIGDIVCFRNPYVTYDPNHPIPPSQIPPVEFNAPPLQAYPGRVNINTAERPVLRSVFLLMFDGPMDDPDDDGDVNGPMPRVPDGSNNSWLNLRNPAITDEWRFRAMMVADTYAHQVCEYRRWIYNNKGYLGITDETVPSNLPMYEQIFAGLTPPVSHYGNYRANPFYPLVDTDGDTIAPDIRNFNPDPPFRSVADLFRVMLYDNDMFGEYWTYEGIGSVAGPDDGDLPEPLDSTGAPVGTVNALEVWGPIYNADDERTCTHPAGPLGSGTLYGFVTKVDNDPSGANYNNFYEHQSFRLFSADDFRRIAPWLTVRTYNYRIESRGVVRVAAGNQRTDITRDKIWIITTNTEANFGQRRNPVWDWGIASPLDHSYRAQNQGLNEFFVLYFEETPQSGLPLTRSNFLPD